MRYKVGDIIEIVRDDWTFRYRHKGTLGKVLEIRSYHKSHTPTHYRIKFTCFTIPHIYSIGEIDRTCELYKVKRKNYDRQRTYKS